MKRAEDEAGVRMTWSAGQPRSSPRLPPPAAAAVVIVGVNREDVSGQSTDQTMWPYVMLLCVLGPFWRRPVTVLAIITVA